jgi:hypothetical protein
MRIIENSSSRLRLRETTGYLPIFLAAGAIVIAVIVISRHDNPKQLINSGLLTMAAVFFRRESRITLDKPARRCGIWRQDMWRRSYRAIAFDEIEDVEVEIQKPNTDVLAYCRLCLVASSGKVPLTAGFSATLDWQIKVRETMIDAIFVGRPRPAALDPVQLLLDAGRPFAAAKRA